MTRLLRSALRGGLVATLLAAATIVLAAQPAGAHGLGGLQPTNYQSKLVGLTPAVPGLHVRLTDLGTKVELTNDTGRDVVVLGYSAEPYLRVGPRGVFENARSPAVTINQSATNPGKPPKSADASAPPEWRKISSGTTATWHDHRAHFMGTDDPPLIQRNHDRRLVFDHWTIPLVQGDRSISVRGELVYVPPPSPWPYVIGALALAIGVFAVSRTRWWRQCLGGALAVTVVAELAHVIGLWDASTASTGTKLVESLYSIGGIALGVLALVWMARRSAEAAVPIVLIAAIVLVVAGGLADITTLGRSQLPTTLPPALARVLVTVTLGLGVGMVAATLARLRLVSPGRPSGGRSRPRPRTAAAADATVGS
jgi:hypothetical protein